MTRLKLLQLKMLTALLLLALLNQLYLQLNLNVTTYVLLTRLYVAEVSGQTDFIASQEEVLTNVLMRRGAHACCSIADAYAEARSGAAERVDRELRGRAVAGHIPRVQVVRAQLLRGALIRAAGTVESAAARIA